MISWVAIVGDITPADGIPKAEKSRREQEAIDHMCKLLGGGSIGTKLVPPRFLCLLFLYPKLVTVFHNLVVLFMFQISAKEIGELWLEYEGNSSPEAKIVKDLDKVCDMFIFPVKWVNLNTTFD